LCAEGRDYGAISNAKCPPSMMWISAFGTSRRYYSGSDGSNDDSYLPHITSRRGCFSRINASHFGNFLRWCGSRRKGRFECRSVGLVEKIIFIGPQIRVVTFHVGIVAHVSRTRGREREQIFTQRAFVCRAIGPIRTPRFPIRAQAGVMRHRVLNDQRFHSLWMRQDHAKATQGRRNPACKPSSARVPAFR